MERFQLSPIEMSFWYQYKFDPSSDANNIVHRVEVKLVLSGDMLQRAFRRIIARHPALRSRFMEEDGVPYRLTEQQEKMALIDGGGMTLQEKLTEIRRPFVLESGALLRVIFSIRKRHTILYISLPHILFDANSWDIFLKDFAAALRDELDDSCYSLRYPVHNVRATEYWKKRISDRIGRVPFETSSSSVSAAGIMTREDEEQVFERLIAYGAQNGLSANSLCMTLLSVALNKLTNAGEFIVATPVTTRSEEHLGQIGSFINVLPSFMVLDKTQSLSEFVMNEALRIWNDIDERHFSLIDLLSDMQHEYADDQGIYNAMTEYVTDGPLDLIFSSVEPVYNTRPKLDFVMSVLRKADKHSIVIEYDAGKFSERYITVIGNVFLLAAKALLNDSNIRIKDMEMTTKADRQALVAMGRGPEKVITPPFIWKRILNSALANPEKMAVTETNKSVTYAELLNLSSRYAAWFAENGATSGSVVGVYMERGVDSIAAMLAIWSLGSVYLPLDVNLPTQRVNYMLESSRAVLVVSGGSHSLQTSIPLCRVEESPTPNGALQEFDISGEDTAYIIFTSGTTGKPKGVMISHRGFLNHLEIMVDHLSLTSKDVVAQTAEVSFDISVWQSVCSFIVGASIAVISRDVLLEPERLYGAIKEGGISILQVIPSLLSLYLTNESTNPACERGLAGVKVISTGEPLDASIAAQWVDRYPEGQLTNAYGPAEASDDTHFFTIPDNSDTNKAIVPIGTPLRNIRTYILNEDGQMYPRGVTGEIYLGGIAVANGYISEDEEENNAFSKDTIFGDGSERLYRTGDYGRWDDGGNLEYHGRKDGQVKVRGQRLELEDVESRLKSIQLVADAAVVAVPAPSGLRLVALVCTEDATTDVDAVRAQLKKELPDYMVPSVLMIVPSLPKNNNGKLDRRRVFALATAGDVEDKEAATETLGLAATIANVYSKVLGTGVSADANYFKSGGDSISSMKIVYLLQQEGLEVAIRDILMYQTPQELAQALEARRNEYAEELRVAPLYEGYTPIQAMYLRSAGSTYEDSGEIQAAIIHFHIDSRAVVKGLRRALQDMMAAHHELTPRIDSAPLVIEIPPSKTKETHAMVEELRGHVSLHHPLVVAVLPNQINEGLRLLLVAHHFIIDFYSWAVIREELAARLANRAQANFSDVGLRKWLGLAIGKLRQENTSEKISFWQTNLSSRAKPVETVGQTTVYSYTHPVPANARERSVPLEVVANYALTKGYLEVGSAAEFNYLVESSLRTIDQSGLLAGSVGWMTYAYPLLMKREEVAMMPVERFRDIYRDCSKMGYEYGLLREAIAPQELMQADEIVWTVNYVGKMTSEIQGTEIVEAIPEKEKPFVEVEITEEGGTLTYKFMHNTSMTQSDFDLLNTQINQALASATSSPLSPKRLTAERQAAILKRLVDE